MAVRDSEFTEPHEIIDGWHIYPVSGPFGWIAVRCPTPTSEHVLAADTLIELRKKISAMGESEGNPA